MKRKAPDDSVFDLDAKKRVAVRKFNGVPSEYYEDKTTKELKPGKKGIALTADVWRQLLARQDEINDALAQLGQKRDKPAEEDSENEKSGSAQKEA
ncbi:RNA polymerase II transcriptional coactivator SUB1 [Meyerozyma sp. JA9]|nr:RNA polymerase II transcriptional coactivator SUB1 [Meyerozyma sp. JA9]